MLKTERLREGVREQINNLLILSDKELRYKIAKGENYDVDWDSLEESETYSTIVGVACYLAGVCDALNCQQCKLFSLLAIDLDKVLDEE